IMCVFSKGVATEAGFTPGMGTFLVVGIIYGLGAALGGPTGYALNPARDLSPRIAHFVLPIPGKRDSDWGYALIPVIGPLVGAVGAYFFCQAVGIM
ncbi:MAG: aquaporin, partial [Synergistaceae bacterium]|nr:aquaporin [Synergistaceae bacterium]